MSSARPSTTACRRWPASCGPSWTLQFEIRCQFWSMPYPLELLLKTSLDLETGQVSLQNLRA
jgi:predicted component of type VI protein secretion system